MLEEKRLQADVVIPAEAQQQAKAILAVGDAAPTAENGAAAVHVLDLMGEAWRSMGPQAREIYVIQHLEEIVGTVVNQLADVSVDEFLDRFAEYDDAMQVRYSDAQQEGRVLRYIATLDPDGSAAVGLQAVSSDDAFSNMQLTDNLVQFQSDRYSKNPLVIQGPGAGPEVTAGGVFGDLLQLAANLGNGSH